MAELDLIRWIRARIPRSRPGVLVDSGDDAAVVRLKGRDVLFKTDSVIDGVHFDSRVAPPEAIGHKAVARPLSDLAAMAGIPEFAVVAMMAPRSVPEPWLKRVMVGMERTATRFGVAIVGGDLKSHPGRLAIAVAMIGRLEGRPILRSGARTGDAIAVTGPLGGSIHGKHLRFTPRVREALELRKRVDLHAMIDVSDGLSTDLAHLCEESGVGATIDEARIPVARAAKGLVHALTDGEDYELLFALPARQTAGLRHVIGTIDRAPGLRLRRRDGRIEEIRVRGWEHRFGR